MLVNTINKEQGTIAMLYLTGYYHHTKIRKNPGKWKIDNRAQKRFSNDGKNI